MDDFTPKRRKNGNGKRRNGKNQRDKTETMGFEAPGFFSGLRANGNGIPKADSPGLAIPELGEGFNTRFGRIGSGFVENVNTFKVGFGDVLTGNGRTGEIISTGVGRRPRGRPRKSAVGSLLSGRRRGPGRPRKSETKEKKGVKIGKAVVGGKEGKTVGSLLASSAGKGIKGGVSKLRGRSSQFTATELAAEKEIDVTQAEMLRERLAEERERKAREGPKIFEVDDDMDMDLTDEEVQEDDEEILDEDMEEEELPALTDETRRQEIDEISRRETEGLR